MSNSTASTPDQWFTLSSSRRARLTGVAGGLRGVDLAVFIVMAEHANGAGKGCTASLFTIAKEAGWCLRAVRTAARRLELGDWIRRTRRSKGGLTRAATPNATSRYNVLTLPEPPGDRLMKSRRTAALFPENRLLRVVKAKGGRHQMPTSNPA